MSAEIRRLLDKWQELASAYVSDVDMHHDAARLRICADELEALLPAPQQEEQPTIDCPACGASVRQVASATLSLALWQHWEWVCTAHEKQNREALPPSPSLPRQEEPK